MTLRPPLQTTRMSCQRLCHVPMQDENGSRSLLYRSVGSDPGRSSLAAPGHPRRRSWWRTCLPVQETERRGFDPGSGKSPGGGDQPQCSQNVQYKQKAWALELKVTRNPNSSSYEGMIVGLFMSLTYLILKMEMVIIPFLYLPLSVHWKISSMLLSNNILKSTAIHLC